MQVNLPSRDSKLTAWRIGILEQLVVAQPVKKFFAFDGIRRSITVFATARIFLCLEPDKIITRLLYYLRKIHFNIIFQSMPRFSN